eukprot:11642649-Ditylum_brightwellii.AAC.1
MEKSKQNEHVVCNKDNEVDDGVEDGNNDSVEDGDDADDDGVDNGDDAVDDCDEGADKHFTHLSQVADCCLMERSEQNKHVVCNKDNDVDNDGYDGVDNGDDDSVDNGDYGVDGADKHFTHPSQAADCCLMERSKQNKH